jgi:hypothetical protein
MSIIAIHRGETLPAPSSVFDDTGRLYLYVPASGGTFPFNVDIIATFGSDPTGQHWCAKPFQTQIGAPTFITGTLGSGTGYVNVLPNTGAGGFAGYIDLQVGESYNVFASTGPYYVKVYQYGVGTNWWVPPDGFDPGPSGWTPGDPPPAPFVPGDPPPPGWTPPVGYTPDVCGFTLVPYEAGYDRLAHTDNTLLTASRDSCTSEPTTPNDWITLGSTPNIGTYHIPYAISQNNGRQRRGAIYAGGLYLAITQAGRDSGFTPGSQPVTPYTPGPACSATYTKGPARSTTYTRGDDPCEDS